MKTVFISINLLLISLSLYAQDVASITAVVDNVKNNNGVVRFTLHTDATFMKTQPVQAAAVNIIDGKAEIVFEGIDPGVYAVLVIHDENDNNQMDFDTNGMPKESYGMSNNPMSFGPPQFQDAKFELGEENLRLNIRF